MVNAKGVAFKVNRQTPLQQPNGGTGVINCRKLIGKRALKEQREAQAQYVALTNVDGTLKRKRGEEEETTDPKATSSFLVYQSFDPTSTTPEPPVRKWQPPKPPRTRKIKNATNTVVDDCWYIIFSYADPAQLLQMRSKVPVCYRFLRDGPKLWKKSRWHYYGEDLPEPPSELTEFQYSDLLHDHGCQSCKAPNTRKTYWAFLRRWCKTCLNSKTEKEHDALNALHEAHGEESALIQKCLPSGIFDSWGNFVGVGPATTHALKTVYLIQDVKALVAEYSNLKARNKDPLEWPTEFGEWYKAKTAMVEERRVFAQQMEAWEETVRSDRTSEYTAKKTARKTFFQKKAAELSPPISVGEIECCPSYKRAIAIPKDPNNTSWLQLKPKLEKEASELRVKGGPAETRLLASSAAGTGTSTPVRTMEPQHTFQFPNFPSGFPLPLHFQTPPSLPSQNQVHIHLPPIQAHSHLNFPPGPVSHMMIAAPLPQPLPPPPPQSHVHQDFTGLPPNQLPRDFTGLPPPHSHMF
jgi:hypothetical protein